MKKEKSRVVGGVVVPNSTVETPAHIAEVMRGLLSVNKDSVIYDPCAGRGNLIKDAGCTTIAVEHEPQFKDDLERVADVTIIDSCFNVDKERLVFEMVKKELSNNEDLKTELLKNKDFQAELLKVCYNVNKARIEAAFLEQLKGDNKTEAILDFTIAMSDLDEAYEEAKKAD